MVETGVVHDRFSVMLIPRTLLHLTSTDKELCLCVLVFKINSQLLGFVNIGRKKEANIHTPVYIRGDEMEQRNWAILTQCQFVKFPVWMLLITPL